MTVKSMDRLIKPGPLDAPMSSTEVGDLFVALWRRWKTKAPLKKGAITQEQYWVLKTVYQEGPQMIKDLAQKLGCTPGSASVTAKRMERDGLVRRQRSRDDERVVTVRLADEGLKKLDSWKAEQRNSMASLFEPLTSVERRYLARLLTKALSESEKGVPIPEGRRS